MKKIAALLIVLGIVLACFFAFPEKKAPAMVIRPSEFNEETLQILSIFDEELVFFDYTTDDSVRSMHLDLFTCKDGVWSNYGRSMDDIEPGEHRICLRFYNDGYEIITFDESGHSSARYTAEEPVEASGGYTSSRLSEETGIRSGEEIELYTKLYFPENTAIRTSDDFRNSGCTSGIAAVITFSEEELQ